MESEEKEAGTRGKGVRRANQCVLSPYSRRIWWGTAGVDVHKYFSILSFWYSVSYILRRVRSSFIRQNTHVLLLFQQHNAARQESCGIVCTWMCALYLPVCVRGCEEGSEKSFPVCHFFLPSGRAGERCVCMSLWCMSKRMEQFTLFLIPIAFPESNPSHSWSFLLSLSLSPPTSDPSRQG